MNTVKVAFLAITLLSISACSVTASQGVIKPAEQASGPFGMFTHDAIKTEGDKAFSGVKKLGIASFKVAFITSKKEKENAGRGIGGHSTAEMTLKGITPELMQTITDKAYQDLLTQLQISGYEVADRAQLTTSSEFSGANTEASPYTEEASFFGSDNTVTFVAPKTIGKLYFFTGDNGPSGGFGFDNPTTAASTFADKHKLPVISVVYTLDFSAKNGSGGSFASTSALEVGQALSVTPGSGIALFGGMGGTFSTTNGSVRLGQAITYPDPYGEIVMTTTDTEKVLETANNVAGLLLGAGSNQTRDFEVTADPSKYATGADSILKKANADLLQSMQKLR